MRWGGPRASEILDFGRELANRMTADRTGKLVQPAGKTSIWANVNGHGDADMRHCHAGEFWSGACYVDDGGSGADETPGGEFEMLDPRGPGPAVYAPTGRGWRVGGAAEMIRPRAGLLLLFPSWLFHRVRPYRGSALRISIALNLSV